MKNRTLLLNDSFNNLSQKKLLVTWILYHSAVALFFLISLLIFRGKIGIDSDLFNMVPKSISMASVKKADDKMMSVTSKNVFVLVADENFDKAKDVAEAVYAELKDSRNFESISLYNDVSAMGEITDFLYKYRSYLIDEEYVREYFPIDKFIRDIPLGFKADEIMRNKMNTKRMASTTIVCATNKATIIIIKMEILILASSL